MKLTFGKYKGCLLRDITDTQYLTWLYRNADNIDEVSRSKIANRVRNLKKYQNPGKRELTDKDKRTLVRMIDNHKDSLTEWEINYLSDIVNYDYVSTKQINRINFIVDKIQEMVSE